MHAAVAGSIQHVVEVSEIAGGIAPASKRGARAAKTRLRAECGIFVELLGAIIGIEQEFEVVVTNVAPRGVNGLEREAGAVAKTGANRPAGLLFESGRAG